MLRKLWRQLRRQERGMKMIGPAGTGKTMILPGNPGEGRLETPMYETLPYVWRFLAEQAARLGFKPVIFIDDEVGVNEIPLPPQNGDAPQE